MKAGDVVQLKSGGQKMTIIGILGDPNGNLDKTLENALTMGGYKKGDVYCQWFNEKNKLEYACLKPIVLEVVNS